MSKVTIPCIQVAEQMERKQNLIDYRRVRRAERYGSRAVKSAIRQLHRLGWSDFSIIDVLRNVQGWKI